jgi:hypothetical protein
MAHGLLPRPHLQVPPHSATHHAPSISQELWEQKVWGPRIQDPEVQTALRRCSKEGRESGSFTGQEPKVANIRVGNLFDSEKGQVPVTGPRDR